MAQMTLALALKAQDYASRVMNQMRANVNKASKDIENQSVQSGVKQQTTARRTAQITEQSYRKMQQAARVIARDRESLGVRSENLIQREIAQTIAAYDRLKRSGTASSRELARAAETTRAKIAGLNAEMGKTTLGQRTAGFMRVGGAMVAGAVGIKNAIAPALNDKKQWDSNVAEVALTAFSDKSAGYIQNEGFAKINQAVLETVDKYGGTADQALQGLDGMLKGGMSFDEAVANLGTSQKMQIAANASGEDVGSLVKTLSDYGFKGNDLNKALEMVLQSGYDGKFEVSDMVSKLPSILSTAKNNAYSGIEDFKFILSWLQSAANKAGSNDEAATNVSNALNKQTAADTVTRLKKLDHPALKGKGIDVEKSMLDGAKKE
ncbi:Phage-related minor tail protein [Rodentibacter pneumotropicus]|uniref:Phage-related minor tail protein n=1 Tax=Rodentibacter pneumotropicus TaxID=758 RepID=A0A3S4TY16_9PAST|nr:Phage-related minor tail protein [Rodentibacter pneumotropicus]